MVHLRMVIICMIIFTGLFFLPVSSNNYVIFVNSSQMLEEQLDKISNGHNNQPITLELDPSRDYRLVRENFTLIANTTITIKSMYNRSLDISCGNGTVFQSTRGLAFVNSNVTIKQVNFKSCGSYLNRLPEDILKNLNSSKHLYYRNTHSAALLFVNSRVYMNQVKVVSSYGFAIIAHNVIFAELVSIHVTKSLQNSSIYKHHRIGSGMMIYFTDSSTSSITRKIYIVNSTFDYNMDRGVGNGCFKDLFGQIPMKISLPYGVGLTILYTQSMYTVKTVIDGGTFSSNVGMLMGAVVIIHLRASVSTTEVTNSIFFNSTLRGKLCFGSGLQLYSFDTKSTAFFNMLKIQDSSFFGYKDKKRHTQQLGDINIGIYNSKVRATIIFERLYFTQHNVPLNEGICIAVSRYDQSSHINVTMKDITAMNNTNNHEVTKSIFYFENVKNVSFTGNGQFEINHGSVIHCENSNLFLYGRQLFRNNLGNNGGAIRLEGKGQLNFMEGANLTFIKNQAYFSGGAIYVDSYSYRTCGIQLHKPTTVSFHDNNGKTAGNSIFVQPINECQINGNFRKSWISQYMNYFIFTRTNETNNSLLELSTCPKIFGVLWKQNGTFSGIKHHLSELITYPGKSIFFKVRAKDKMGRNVFSFINTQVFSHQPAGLGIQQSGGNFASEGSNDNVMKISIHTTSSDTITASFVIIIPKIISMIFHIQLLSCPLGFDLDQTSRSCVCSSLLQIMLPKTECSIQDSTITRNGNGHIWIGTIDSKLAISKTCPHSYCNSDSKRGRLKSTNDEIMLINDANELVPFCSNGRHGVLCGKCNDTHQNSLVFGSTECKQCSNWWLLTIIIYAVMGPLLICTLFAFKLTLTTGTLNGMIFYSQVYNAEFLSQMDNVNESVSKLSSVCKLVLSVMNTNQNFPLCLYNGMNQLWKTGLGLTFPVYLLLLVVVIIILSRYSTWLSNKTSHSSVQVLVTVVHLSFSKLLLTLIDVYTPANIYTSLNDTYRVWYWDGSVEFLGSSHSILATVTTLTVGLFIIPYIALLLIGKHLIRYSKRFNFYIRPVYEAIHAPYKGNRQYWFGARLLLTITIYIVYVLLRTRNYTILSIIVSTLLTGFTVAQAIARPFKNSGLNILDTWLMFNITLVYNNMLWDTTDTSSIKSVFTLIFVILAIAAFVIIIACHVAASTKCIRKWIKIKLIQVKRYYYMYYVPLTISSLKNQKAALHGNDSYYNSCSHYREPLIMDSTDESETQ